jgi:hypothetical protein
LVGKKPYKSPGDEVKIIVFSDDPYARSAAEAYRDQFGKGNWEIVALDGVWHLTSGEALIVFAHGSMAMEDSDGPNGVKILPAFIGDEAGYSGNHSGNFLHKDAAAFANEMQHHAPSDGSKWTLRIHACETADVNTDIGDTTCLPERIFDPPTNSDEKVPDDRRQRQLPDSFAGALSDLLNADVGARWGSPDLHDPMLFEPSSAIWKIRCDHYANLQVDKVELVGTCENLDKEGLWRFDLHEAEENDESPPPEGHDDNSNEGGSNEDVPDHTAIDGQPSELASPEPEAK